MHIELGQLIAYRDGALDEPEREVIKQKLAECEECRARYAALEHLATSFKDYFAKHRPVKGTNCPNGEFWVKYLNGKLEASDETHWKKHLQQCDYCFDIVTSRLIKDADESLAPQEWLREKLTDKQPSFQKQVKDFAAKIRNAWTGLFAVPKWAFAATATIIVVLFIGWFVREQVTFKTSINQAKLSGKSIQLADGNYKILTPSEQIHSKDFSDSSEQSQEWYNALISKEQSGSVVALLTPSTAEALRMLVNSQNSTGMKRLMSELEAQVIKVPSKSIDEVLIDEGLAEQLIQKTYTLNQHLLLTFLSSDKAKSDTQTVLKIGLQH
ncbi:MAG: hypothetical protein QG641_497 [Candidatus Poribacteria bacterium]|nr:hypothetical protein [Candidatus Poribacteria bacterium]